MVLHQKKFSAHVKSVCYGDGMVIAAVGNRIHILNSDFVESQTIPGTQVDTIALYTRDSRGEFYYIISGRLELKKLNENLEVQSIRNAPAKKVFWVKDRKTKKIQLAFLTTSDPFPNGCRFHYETGYTEPLGWRYEILPEPQTEERIYKTDMNASLACFEGKPPYRQMIFENYSGIWFFQCSFHHIRGNLSAKKNQVFIRQNGGIIDGDPE